MGSTTFTDSSSDTHTITANGDVVNVAPKMGKGMAAFDGVDDYLTYPKEIMYFDWGDFTVEGWWYVTSDASAIFMEQGTNNDSCIQIWYDGNDEVWVYLDDDGSGWSFSQEGATDMPIDAMGSSCCS